MDRSQRGTNPGLGTLAAESRHWAVRQVREHPVSTGLGLLTLGFVSAALVPSSRAERRAVARATETGKDLAERLEVPRRLEETIERAREAAVLRLASAIEAGVQGDTGVVEAPARRDRKARQRR